jgi:hypothetical protein
VSRDKFGKKLQIRYWKYCQWLRSRKWLMCKNIRTKRLWRKKKETSVIKKFFVKILKIFAGLIAIILTFIAILLPWRIRFHYTNAVCSFIDFCMKKLAFVFNVFISEAKSNLNKGE